MESGMTIKRKSWLWWFTFPFAHNNYTTIGKTIYYPNGYPPSPRIIRHEAMHSFQQSQVGIVKFLLLYLFALPFFWNPWRYRWEMEAYIFGSQLDEAEARRILRSVAYGWLIFNGHRKP
jgi:hypothetical protein